MTIPTKIIELSNELCADYPHLDQCSPLERLDAIEGLLRGTIAANQDLHILIHKLRLKFSLSPEELKEIYNEN